MSLCICVCVQKPVEEEVLDSTVDTTRQWTWETGKEFQFPLYILLCALILWNNFTEKKQKTTTLSRMVVKETTDLCMASREHCRGALKQALGNSYRIRNWPASGDKQPYNRRSYTTARMKIYDNREPCHSAEGKGESERLKSVLERLFLQWTLRKK